MISSLPLGEVRPMAYKFLHFPLDKNLWEVVKMELPMLESGECGSQLENISNAQHQT